MQAACKVMVDAIFEGIVRGGDKIEIRGFGSFHTRQRQSRVGRNPKTGARVEVPAKGMAFFQVGKDLKAAMKTTERVKDKIIEFSAAVSRSGIRFRYQRQEPVAPCWTPF
jgi:integration host factor subunit beta